MRYQTVELVLNHFGQERIFSSDYKECLELVWNIIDISNKLMKEGINELEKFLLTYQKKDIFSKGLFLIVNGMDVDTIETILGNSILFSKNPSKNALADILSIEGILLMQRGVHPMVSAEILKSYFGIEYEEVFDLEFEKVKPTLALDEIRKMSDEEVQMLLEQDD